MGRAKGANRKEAKRKSSIFSLFSDSITYLVDENAYYRALKRSTSNQKKEEAEMIVKQRTCTAGQKWIMAQSQSGGGE